MSSVKMTLSKSLYVSTVERPLDPLEHFFWRLKAQNLFAVNNRKTIHERGCYSWLLLINDRGCYSSSHEKHIFKEALLTRLKALLGII